MQFFLIVLVWCLLFVIAWPLAILLVFLLPLLHPALIRRPHRHPPQPAS